MARFTTESQRWAPKHDKDAKVFLRRIVDALRHPPQVVDQAIDEALNDIATREPGQRTFGAYARYFSKVLNSTAELITKAQIAKREQIEIATTRIQKERQIAAQGVEAHQKAIANGAARRASVGTASVKRNSGTTTNDDGREIFVEDTSLRTIGFHRITGADGNRILRDVPMASPSDVRDILVDVSDKRSLSKDPSAKEILDKATQKLRVRLMYAKHGPPTQWCRGQPANFPNASTDWFVIGGETVEQWRSASPHAFPAADKPDYERTYLEDATLSQTARDVLRFADHEWQTYGTGLQQQVEAKFESLLAERHHKAVEEMARREAKQAQILAEAEHLREITRRVSVATERARCKLGVTPGDWTRVDWQKRERLVNAELGDMRDND